MVVMLKQCKNWVYRFMGLADTHGMGHICELNNIRTVHIIRDIDYMLELYDEHRWHQDVRY